SRTAMREPRPGSLKAPLAVCRGVADAVTDGDGRAERPSWLRKQELTMTASTQPNANAAAGAAPRRMMLVHLSVIALHRRSPTRHSGKSRLRAGPLLTNPARRSPGRASVQQGWPHALARQLDASEQIRERGEVRRLDEVMIE